jgi:hypothetical protein
MLTDLLRDGKGNLSHARFVNLLCGCCASLYCWKLVILGGFNETFFGLYLLYGAGQQTINKALDVWLHLPTRSGDGKSKDVEGS